MSTVFSPFFVLVGKCPKFARKKKKTPSWESSYRGWKVIIEGALQFGRWMYPNYLETTNYAPLQLNCISPTKLKISPYLAY